MATIATHTRGAAQGRSKSPRGWCPVCARFVALDILGRLPNESWADFLPLAVVPRRAAPRRTHELNGRPHSPE
jgi:hypothetical protein